MVRARCRDGSLPKADWCVPCILDDPRDSGQCARPGLPPRNRALVLDTNRVRWDERLLTYLRTFAPTYEPDAAHLAADAEIFADDVYGVFDWLRGSLWAGD